MRRRKRKGTDFWHQNDTGSRDRRAGSRPGGRHRNRLVTSPGAATAMTKSELIQRLAEKNPHLYQRDLEIIINTIFGEITAALMRGDPVGLPGFVAFAIQRPNPPLRPNPPTDPIFPPD